MVSQEINQPQPVAHLNLLDSLHIQFDDKHRGNSYSTINKSDCIEVIFLPPKYTKINRDKIENHQSRILCVHANVLSGHS